MSRPHGATHSVTAAAIPAIRRLAPTEVEPIFGVMARAFDADPIVNFVVKQDRHRPARVRSFLRLAVEPCLPHGEVYVTDGLEGGAFWIPPGKYDTSLRAQLRLIPNLTRAAGLPRLLATISALEAVEREHPSEPHFYLPMIGIDPPHQGRGLGTALMRPVLERCDRERVPAYLETGTERNLPLYERNGFRIAEATRLGKDGPPMWLMWRDPQ